MGIASPASLLPIYDAVEFTIEFAVSELLPRTRLPVYIGLPLFDPRLRPITLMERLRGIGISGLANFPATFHFAGHAPLFERYGLGLDREIAFLEEARNSGLQTIGYVRSRTDAEAMVAAGISTLCINFSLNPPQVGDVHSGSEDRIGPIAVAARDIVSHVRKPNGAQRIYLGGGSVSGGADLDKLCRAAGIDGFIGGSAMDRAPLEKSLINSVQSFREIEVLQNRVERLRRRLGSFDARYGVICHSASMNAMLDRLEAIVKTGSHVIVTGEPDTGRLSIARMVGDRIARNRRLKPANIAMADTPARLFGRAAASGRRRLVGLLELSDARTPIILCDLSAFDRDHQAMLAEYMETGTYHALEEARSRIGQARLVCMLEGSVETALASGCLDLRLAEILRRSEIAVPPLRDRIEDIPFLVRQITADMAMQSDDLAPSLMRTLIRHNWPDNIGELRRALEWLFQQPSRPTEAQLASHLSASHPAEQGAKAISQRDRIIQALLLNNLNRSQTAAHLGITRKTLYNQIKKYNILS